MENVREKLRNIYLIVEDIKNFPQTYDSILKHERKDGTCQTILRRKLNKLCKEGVVCKTSIPGTRFGKVIYYVYPKKYIILFEAGRTGSNVYCYYKINKLSRYYMSLNKYWKLEKGEWIEYNEEKILFEGNVLKII